MLRSSLVALCALGFATAAQAADFDGPYVGGAVTVDSFEMKVPGIDALGASGVGGSLFAGYNSMLDERGFVGVEANLDLNTANFVVGDDVDNVEVDAEWGMGVGARVGAF